MGSAVPLTVMNLYIFYILSIILHLTVSKRTVQSSDCSIHAFPVQKKHTTLDSGPGTLVP